MGPRHEAAEYILKSRIGPALFMLQWGRGTKPRNIACMVFVSESIPGFNGAAARSRGISAHRQRSCVTMYCFNGAAARSRGISDKSGLLEGAKRSFNGAAARSRGI